MSDSTATNEPSRPPETLEIAKLVLMLSGATIAAIAMLALIGAAFGGTKQFIATSQMVFNALLPLLGTWVGTVLAYYFSRKNFEAASHSVERMVNLTVDQKLGTLAVGKEMMRLHQITLFQIPANEGPEDVLLTELRSKLAAKITRVPIVDANGVVQYILHQSGLFRFLADKALAGQAAVKTLTLKDLIDDAELQQWVTNIVYVDETATVADAKRKMEDRPGCQDLVVTRTGSNKDPMIGWMTNVDIGRLSKA